jgi:hypothetical protein
LNGAAEELRPPVFIAARLSKPMVTETDPGQFQTVLLTGLKCSRRAAG